jgi:integrase
MADRLTDSDVRKIPPPATGNKVTYDSDVTGFGVRVTSAGARAFVLNYRASGRERRITIGGFPDWSVKAARERAKTLKRQIDLGEDPMAQRHEERGAKTVADLCDLYVAEYLPARRATTQEDYRGLIRLYIRPEFGKMKVEALTHRDIAKLHRQIAQRAPYRANRMAAVLSTMIGLAIKEGWRTDNPTQGIERAEEEKRERFLSPEEIVRLADALAAHPEKISAHAIRLLLLTGARRSEALTATWDQFDLSAGVWTKPSAHTKQKKVHRVPLSAPAMALLADMRKEAVPGCSYVFPSAKTSKSGTGNVPPSYEPLTEIKRTWSSVCKTAGITGVRLHDLRHSYASVLASGGLSLHIVGALLGHTQPRTTARYAHLYDDVLRAATERVGAVVTGAPKAGAEVTSIAAGRSR